MEKEKLKHILKEANLNNSERLVCLSLIEEGPQNISSLARITKLNRTTVHFVVKNLVRRGILEKSKLSNRVVVDFSGVETIKQIINNKKKQFDRYLRELEEFASYSAERKRQLKKFNLVKVKYFVGKEECSLIYKDVLKSDEAYSFVNIELVEKFFPENMQKFSKTVKSKGCFLKEIIDDSPVARRYISQQDKSRYKYKFFSKEKGLELFFKNFVDFMIYSGKIAIVTEKSEELFGVVIENENIYRFSKMLFKMIWNAL